MQIHPISHSISPADSLSSKRLWSCLCMHPYLLRNVSLGGAGSSRPCLSICLMHVPVCALVAGEWVPHFIQLNRMPECWQEKIMTVTSLISHICSVSLPDASASPAHTNTHTLADKGGPSQAAKVECHLVSTYRRLSSFARKLAGFDNMRTRLRWGRRVFDRVKPAISPLVHSQGPPLLFLLRSPLLFYLSAYVAMTADCHEFISLNMQELSSRPSSRLLNNSSNKRSAVPVWTGLSLLQPSRVIIV